MSVTSLLERIEERKIQIVVEGDHLRYQAPKGALTPELRQELKARKAEVIAHLQDPRVLRQAAMFREHLDRPGPALFYVTPGANIRDGFCLTCGEEPPTGRLGVRCRVCCTAARLAIED